jgi:3-deoxy-D-manno-octulosonic-acid transferase
MNTAGLYRLATRAALPLAHFVLARRAARGKEDPARLGERWGKASSPRPDGQLVWLHAASVGESLSLLPIIDRLLLRLPTAQILVTTGTVTSARLLADRLPQPRARHQFAPLDHPGAVARFLDHWHPDLAIWVESELWPNLILETHRRGIPMALLNARMSSASFRGWQRWPSLIMKLLNCFDIVLAQDADHVLRLVALGAASADTVGDLKAAGSLPPVSEKSLAAHRNLIGNRPVWLAASTHPGEELIVAEAHQRLRAAFPGVLTLLAPRHPARAPEVEAMLRHRGLRVARHSAGKGLSDDTDIYLIDTMGELGLFYRLASVVLVAGSLGSPGSLGGHNPLEAAQLGCVLLLGPDTVNCAASAAALEAAGAAMRIQDTASLAGALGELLTDPARRSSMGEAASLVAEANRGVIDLALQRLAPLLEQLQAKGPEAGRALDRARA